MAQKLGYHRDGEQLALTPYETEMRRRIFWQLLMHDNMAAAFSGITNQFNASQWDTKPPSNINDADLFPGSMEPVQPRQGPTEMIFVMVMCEVHEFHKCAHHENAADFEAAVMGQDLEGEADSSFRHQAMFEKMRTEVSNVDRKLKEIEEMYCDPSAGNVHMAALAIRPMFTKDFDKILVPMREQPEWGTEIFGPKDNLFKLMVTSNEHRAMVHETMHKVGFQWFMKNKFQLDFFAYLTGQLIIHTQGTLSDRGWECVRATYKDHPELFDVSQKPNLAQAQFTLRAWRAREVTYAKNGWPLETPTYIQQLRDLVPSGDGRSSGKASANVTPSVSMDGLHLTSPQQGQQPSQQMDTSMNSNVDGFMNMPAFTWDMFGDMMPNNSDQFSAAVFGGYGLGNMNMGNLGGMGGMGNMGNMGGNPNNMGGM